MTTQVAKYPTEALAKPANMRIPTHCVFGIFTQTAIYCLLVGFEIGRISLTAGFPASEFPVVSVHFEVCGVIISGY